VGPRKKREKNRFTIRSVPTRIFKFSGKLTNISVLSRGEVSTLSREANIRARLSAIAMFGSPGVDDQYPVSLK
jgi:hypothetical protein